VSVCRQGFTLTQNISWGLLCSAIPTQGTVSSTIMWRCLLKVLCPVRRPITTLDCFLLKDNILVLVAIRGPELSSLSLSASKTLPQCHVLFIQPTLNFLLYTLPRECQGITYFKLLWDEMKWHNEEPAIYTGRPAFLGYLNVRHCNGQGITETRNT
jgi:hypothetical protein